jgi:hypothetical protein
MDGMEAHRFAAAQLDEIESTVSSLKLRKFSYDELHKLVSSRLLFLDGYITALEHTSQITQNDADVIFSRVTKIREWMMSVMPKFFPIGGRL